MAANRGSRAGPLNTNPVDVLIVGAGAAGLALALQVHDHGGHVLIVERRQKVFRPSRAMILHPRTMEMLRPLGVTDALVAKAVRSPQIKAHFGSREFTVGLDAIGLSDTKFARPLLVRQSDLEAVLAAALAERSVVVELGVEFESFAQQPQTVMARLAGPDGAAEVECQYLVGCDGANSSVRAQSAIGWTGGAYSSEVVLADVELCGSVPTDMVHVVAAASGLIFLFPLGEHTTWRLLATRKAVGAAAPLGAFGPPARLAELQQLLSSSGWPLTISHVAWSSRIRLPHRLADQFRSGRVFLVGDAAHTHSPAGGQGMNTGIQDALNLGWKLAFASQAANAVAEQLLASYERERRPVVRRMLGLTRLLFWAEAGTSALPRLARQRVAPLAAVVLSWLPHGLRLGTGAFYVLAQFWVRYRRSPISTDLRTRPRRPQAGDRLPDYEVRFNGRPIRLHELTAQPGVHVLLARDVQAPNSIATGPWVNIHELQGWPRTGVAIIRPDGYIGFRAESVDRSQVAAWLARVGLIGRCVKAEGPAL